MQQSIKTVPMTGIRSLGCMNWILTLPYFWWGWCALRSALPVWEAIFKKGNFDDRQWERPSNVFRLHQKPSEISLTTALISQQLIWRRQTLNCMQLNSILDGILWPWLCGLSKVRFRPIEQPVLKELEHPSNIVLTKTAGTKTEAFEVLHRSISSKINKKKIIYQP